MIATCPGCDDETILRWLPALRWQCTGCGCIVRGFAGYPGRLEASLPDNVDAWQLGINLDALASAVTLAEVMRRKNDK